MWYLSDIDLTAYITDLLSSTKQGDISMCCRIVTLGYLFCREYIYVFRNCCEFISMKKKSSHTNTELRGKFKAESPWSNGKISSSNISNEWIITSYFWLDTGISWCICLCRKGLLLFLLYTKFIKANMSK